MPLAPLTANTVDMKLVSLLGLMHAGRYYLSESLRLYDPILESQSRTCGCIFELLAAFAAVSSGGRRARATSLIHSQFWSSFCGINLGRFTRKEPVP